MAGGPCARASAFNLEFLLAAGELHVELHARNNHSCVQGFNGGYLWSSVSSDAQ